jgi:hypothetical protein
MPTITDSKGRVLKKVPRVFIDSQGRSIRVYRDVTPKEPFYQKHPFLILGAIVLYVLSLPVAFFFGFMSQALPRGTTRRWAEPKNQ